MKKAVLIVGHGSRSKAAQNIFTEIVEMVKAKMSDQLVEGAHMELCEPSIEATVALLAEQGVDSIAIVPYFLYEGIHIREDIPEIIQTLSEQYPHIEFKFGRPIGAESLLADILVQRALEIN